MDHSFSQRNLNNTIANDSLLNFYSERCSSNINNSPIRIDSSNSKKSSYEEQSGEKTIRLENPIINLPCNFKRMIETTKMENEIPNFEIHEVRLDDLPNEESNNSMERGTWFTIRISQDIQRKITIFIISLGSRPWVRILMQVQMMLTLIIIGIFNVFFIFREIDSLTVLDKIITSILVVNSLFLLLIFHIYFIIQVARQRLIYRSIFIIYAICVAIYYVCALYSAKLAIDLIDIDIELNYFSYIFSYCIICYNAALEIRVILLFIQIIIFMILITLEFTYRLVTRKLNTPCIFSETEYQLIQVNLIRHQLIDEIKDISCIICLDTFKAQEVIVMLKCHKTHIYHHLCLKEWIKTNDKCPMCKTIIKCV